MYWELRKSKLYGSGTGQLQHQSQARRDTACQGKGEFGKLGGGKSCLCLCFLFMVPLGLPSARPMVQALRLPFEYLLIIYRALCSTSIIFIILLS